MPTQPNMATPTPDVSRGPVLLSVASIMSSIAFSTTLVRFYLRPRTSRKISLDDYAVIVAMVFGLAGTVFAIIESSMTTSSSALQYNILGQPWIIMATALSQISICLCLMNRLLGLRWRILLGIMVVLTAVIKVAFAAVTVTLLCRPVDKLWNPDTPGECWNPSIQVTLMYSQGAFSVVSWFFLAIFSLVTVRKLDLPRESRWPIYILSCFSFIIGLLAAARTYEASKTIGIDVYTFDTFCASLLSVLEQNISIIAANILPMGSLFSRVAKTTSNFSLRSKAPANRGESPTSSTRRINTHQPIGALSSQSSLTTLIVQGPGRRSHDGATGLGEYEISFDPEAWPRGILKTVSVEVVEEDNPDIQLGMRQGASSRQSENAEQAWETILRGGPASQ